MKIVIKLILIMVILITTKTVYAYTEYNIGDVVTYNNVDYRVIKDSGTKESTVTLLKAEPLKVAEVNEYGAGHVNRYTYSPVGTAYDNNGYGGMAYYASETCGYVNKILVSDGCKNDYASSEIKYVVDAWKAAKAPAATEARLISKDEIDNNFEFEEYDPCGGCGAKGRRIAATWMYNSNYWYWTSTRYNDSSSNVWYVLDNGGLGAGSVNGSGNGFGVVRPVITLKKTTLGDVDETIKEDENESIKDDSTDEIIPDNKNDDKKETTTKVKVENTYMSQTLIVMIIGFISICSGVVIYYLIKNKKIISRR